MWLIPLVAVALGLKRWLPPLASENGAGIDRMLYYLLFTIGGLMIVGHFILGYFILRFGSGGKVTFRQSTPAAEKKWSLIPMVAMALVAEGGVLLLGMPVWAKYTAAQAPADAIRVEVTGEQFAWNVRYPGADGEFGKTDPEKITLDNPIGLDPADAAAQDDLVVLGVMRIPVDKPALVHLRSKDTLHSFFLPHQRVKQDAVPGMVIDTWFIPTEEGDFEIACAELCGFGHFQMRGVVRVQSAEAFEEWLKEEPPFLEFF